METLCKLISILYQEICGICEICGCFMIFYIIKKPHPAFGEMGNDCGDSGYGLNATI
jgi:hypothetical protein